jgi:DNA-binding SARP family transcriptional activator
VVSEADLVLVLRLGAHELLPDDRYEEWSSVIREMIALRWQTLAVEAARGRLRDGRLSEARELLDAALSRDPADEDAHLLLSELLARQGYHYAARRQLHIARRRLAEALGDDAARGKRGLAVAH